MVNYISKVIATGLLTARGFGAGIKRASGVRITGMSARTSAHGTSTSRFTFSVQSTRAVVAWLVIATLTRERVAHIAGQTGARSSVSIGSTLGIGSTGIITTGVSVAANIRIARVTSRTRASIRATRSGTFGIGTAWLIKAWVQSTFNDTITLEITPLKRNNQDRDDNFFLFAVLPAFAHGTISLDFAISIRMTRARVARIIITSDEGIAIKSGRAGTNCLVS